MEDIEITELSDEQLESVIEYLRKENAFKGMDDKVLASIAQALFKSMQKSYIRVMKKFIGDYGESE